MERMLKVLRRSMLGVLVGCALTACAAEVGDADLLNDEDVGVNREGLTTGFLLQNTNTGKCLTASTTAGTGTTLANCNTSNVNQRWGFDGGFLKHSASGLCLSVTGASQANGASVQVSNCNGASNQDFRFYPQTGNPVINWFMVVKHSGQCVEPGAPNGPQVVQGTRCLSVWNLSF